MTRLYLPILLALVTGCDQKTSMETGTPIDTSETGTDTDAVSGYAMDVVVDGQTATVDLSTLATVEFDGEQAVTVVSVLEASGLGASWESRTYDFVGSDGYRPSGNECPPVDHATLQYGYFYPVSGNLVWDEASGLFGCYFVDETVTIDVL